MRHSRYGLSRPRLRRSAWGLPGARTDWPLILAAVSLSLLGAALVGSATAARHVASGAHPLTTSSRHALNLALGLVLCWLVARTAHRGLRAMTPWVYAASIAGLLIVLSPLGASINGAHAWIRLPAGFTLQPSEFAKVALIVGMALILAEPAARELVPGNADVGRTLALAGVPVALILLQPDLGTVMVITAIVTGVLVISGVRLTTMLALGLAGVAGVALAIVLGVFDRYQIERITAFANPEAGALTFGYNTQQARIAIGAGGLFGTGLGSGTQTQGGFVPFNQTDFVFSVAGEELGLFGVLFLLVLLGVVLWRGLVIALNAPDLFGRLVATGVVVWFAAQSFENIGMNLGIMPVTGVPLPFVSYGGSSMFAGWIGIGLLLAIDRASRR